MSTRREFLHHLMISGMLYGSTGRYLLPNIAQAQSAPQPILLFLNLAGGPDLRHLFVPQPDTNSSSYGYNYWSSRFRSHAIGNSFAAWNSRWNSSYHSTSHNGTSFGILNSCGWLVDQWNAGNVAIINNVYGSTNRDHHHSQIIYETGHMGASKNDSDRDGFGGRLANALDANVLSFTSHVRQFCYQPNPPNSASHLSDRTVAAADTRNMGLYKTRQLQDNPNSTNVRAILERGLTSYYAAKRQSIPTNDPFKRFVDQEQGLRDFEQAMNSALQGVTIPTAIQNLYEGDNTLNDTRFGRQIRNVFDSVVAQSVLNFRIGSMDYGGWDTHRGQLTAIESRLRDIFSTGGGFGTLYNELSGSYSTALDNFVIVIGGEFGRQLNDNGDNGTDHGAGMNMVVIGNRVNGGLYGELFPTSEISNSNNGFQRRFGGEILGRTSLENVYQAIATHINQGPVSGIVPQTGTGSTDLESSGLLNNLFS